MTIQIEEGYDQKYGQPYYTAGRKRYYYPELSTVQDCPKKMHALFSAVWDSLNRERWQHKQ